MDHLPVIHGMACPVPLPCGTPAHHPDVHQPPDSPHPVQPPPCTPIQQLDIRSSPSPAFPFHTLGMDRAAPPPQGLFGAFLFSVGGPTPFPTSGLVLPVLSFLECVNHGLCACALGGSPQQVSRKRNEAVGVTSCLLYLSGLVVQSRQVANAMIWGEVLFPTKLNNALQPSSFFMEAII